MLAESYLNLHPNPSCEQRAKRSSTRYSSLLLLKLRFTFHTDHLHLHIFWKVLKMSVRILQGLNVVLRGEKSGDSVSPLDSEWPAPRTHGEQVYRFVIKWPLLILKIPSSQTFQHKRWMTLDDTLTLFGISFEQHIHALTTYSVLEDLRRRKKGLWNEPL